MTLLNRIHLGQHHPPVLFSLLEKFQFSWLWSQVCTRSWKILTLLWPEEEGWKFELLSSGSLSPLHDEYFIHLATTTTSSLTDCFQSWIFSEHYYARCAVCRVGKSQEAVILAMPANAMVTMVTLEPSLAYKKCAAYNNSGVSFQW